MYFGSNQGKGALQTEILSDYILNITEHIRAGTMRKIGTIHQIREDNNPKGDEGRSAYIELLVVYAVSEDATGKIKINNDTGKNDLIS